MTQQEEWRDIPGVLDCQASSLGNIRRKKTGRILRPSPTSSTPVVRVGQVAAPFLLYYKRNRTPPFRLPVTRLVAAAFHGLPTIPECVVGFRDGNKGNRIAANLVWKLRSRFDRAAYMRNLRRRKREGDNVVG